jgi:hypothetical protein
MIPIADQIRALANDAAAAAALRAARAPRRSGPTAHLSHHLRIWLTALASSQTCCSADLEDQATGSHDMLTRAARVATRCGWMRLVTIGSRGRRHYRITEAGRAALAQGEFHIPEGVSRT